MPFFQNFPTEFLIFLLECVVVDIYCHPMPSHFSKIVFIRGGHGLRRKKFESCDFLQYKDCTFLALISKRIELQKRAWSHLEDLFFLFQNLI